MNEIERQMLKNQSTIMNSIVDIAEVNTDSVVSIRDRMKETFELLSPKGTDEDCCDMKENAISREDRQ